MTLSFSGDRKIAARRSANFAGPVAREFCRGNNYRNGIGLPQTRWIVNFLSLNLPSAERPILAMARERRGWRPRRGFAWLEVRARGDMCCRTLRKQLGMMAAGSEAHAIDPKRPLALSMSSCLWGVRGARFGNPTASPNPM